MTNNKVNLLHRLDSKCRRAKFCSVPCRVQLPAFNDDCLLLRHSSRTLRREQLVRKADLHGTLMHYSSIIAYVVHASSDDATTAGSCSHIGPRASTQRLMAVSTPAHTRSHNLECTMNPLVMALLPNIARISSKTMLTTRTISLMLPVSNLKHTNYSMKLHGIHYYNYYSTNSSFHTAMQ